MGLVLAGARVLRSALGIFGFRTAALVVGLCVSVGYFVLAAAADANAGTLAVPVALGTPEPGPKPLLGEFWIIGAFSLAVAVGVLIWMWNPRNAVRGLARRGMGGVATGRRRSDGGSSGGSAGDSVGSGLTNVSVPAGDQVIFGD